MLIWFECSEPELEHSVLNYWTLIWFLHFNFKLWPNFRILDSNLGILQIYLYTVYINFKNDRLAFAKIQIFWLSLAWRTIHTSMEYNTCIHEVQSIFFTCFINSIDFTIQIHCQSFFPLILNTVGVNMIVWQTKKPVSLILNGCHGFWQNKSMLHFDMY